MPRRITASCAFIRSSPAHLPRLLRDRPTGSQQCRQVVFCMSAREPLARADPVGKLRRAGAARGRVLGRPVIQKRTCRTIAFDSLYIPAASSRTRPWFQPTPGSDRRMKPYTHNAVPHTTQRSRPRPFAADVGSLASMHLQLTSTSTDIADRPLASGRPGSCSLSPRPASPAARARLAGRPVGSGLAMRGGGRAAAPSLQPRGMP